MKQLCLATWFAIVGCVTVPAADFATEMLDATFKLYHKNSTGTCFFVRQAGEKPGLYLVTAAHVLEHTKGETAIVVLRELRPDGSYQRRDHSIVIRRDDQPLWIRHATEDTAVLRLAEEPPVPVKSLPLKDLADEARLTAAGLHICSSLFVLTFPERFEGNKAGFAVARQAIIASHPFLPIQEHHTFLADFNTFSGDSGGPVFISGTDGHPLLVGIVLAQIRHDERVKMEYEERTIHHPFGLGSVLHAQFIRDTLEQAARQHAANSKPPAASTDNSPEQIER